MADETPDPADEAAALAVHNLSCPTFDDPSAECAGVNHEDREQAAAAVAAARPHLTAEREAEVARLRADAGAAALEAYRQELAAALVADEGSEWGNGWSAMRKRVLSDLDARAAALRGEHE